MLDLLIWILCRRRLDASIVIEYSKNKCKWLTIRICITCTRSEECSNTSVIVTYITRPYRSINVDLSIDVGECFIKMWPFKTSSIFFSTFAPSDMMDHRPYKPESLLRTLPNHVSCIRYRINVINRLINPLRPFMWNSNLLICGVTRLRKCLSHLSLY